MTLKKIFIYLLFIFIGIIVFIFLYLFFGSLYKFKSLANKYPYSEVVHKNLTTKIPCYVYLNAENNVIREAHRLEVYKTNINSTNVYKIPVGTLLHINEAKSAEKSIVGSASNLVFGTVYIEALGKEVSFEFHWGENPTYGMYDHNENYDIYDLAPWQEKPLPYKYFWDGTKKTHDWEAWRALLQ